MAGKKRVRRDPGEESRDTPRKACCMVSEMLEEMGLDRERARAVRRQVLEGVILMCQWQLERMDEAGRPRRRRAQRVEID